MKTAPNIGKRREVAALRGQLRSAKAQIRHLKDIIKGRELDPVEYDLLQEIGEAHIDDSFEVSFAASLDLSKTRLEFHLSRLLKRGYIEVRFVDPEFGDNFAITQKGRSALFRPSLH